MRIVPRSALKYDTSSLLGQGEFAKVYKADLDGTWVAVKQATPSPPAKRAICTERDALETCVHDNIIRMEGITEDGRGLVLELCRGGTLEDRLGLIRGKRSNSLRKSRRQMMPVRRILQLAVELMRAVEHMHLCGLCHGDIKSANVLLATTQITAQSAGVRLADMGFCRSIGGTISEDDGGSPPFVPRELQLALDTTAHAAHDIYACGVVLLDLACTSKPYEHLTVREFEEAVEESTLYSPDSVPLAEFKNECSANSFLQLVFEMVKHDRSARPTAADAVRRLETMISMMDGEKASMRASRRCRAKDSATDGDASASISIDTDLDQVPPADAGGPTPLWLDAVLPSCDSGVGRGSNFEAEVPWLGKEAPIAEVAGGALCAQSSPELQREESDNPAMVCGDEEEPSAHQAVEVLEDVVMDSTEPSDSTDEELSEQVVNGVVPVMSTEYGDGVGLSPEEAVDAVEPVKHSECDGEEDGSPLEEDDLPVEVSEEDVLPVEVAECPEACKRHDTDVSAVQVMHEGIPLHALQTTAPAAVCMPVIGTSQLTQEHVPNSSSVLSDMHSSSRGWSWDGLAFSLSSIFSSSGPGGCCCPRASSPSLSAASKKDVPCDLATSPRNASSDVLMKIFPQERSDSEKTAAATNAKQMDRLPDADGMTWTF